MTDEPDDVRLSNHDAHDLLWIVDEYARISGRYPFHRTRARNLRRRLRLQVPTFGVRDEDGDYVEALDS
jgi:hypothetical protein